MTNFMYYYKEYSVLLFSISCLVILILFSINFINMSNIKFFFNIFMFMLFLALSSLFIKTIYCFKGD